MSLYDDIMNLTPNEQDIDMGEDVSRISYKDGYLAARDEIALLVMKYKVMGFIRETIIIKGE